MKVQTQLQEAIQEILATKTLNLDLWELGDVPSQVNVFNDVSIAVGLFHRLRKRREPRFYLFFNRDNTYAQWSVVDLQKQRQQCVRSFLSAREGLSVLCDMALAFNLKNPELAQSVLLSRSLLANSKGLAQVNSEVVAQICTDSPFNDPAPHIVFQGSLFVLSGDFMLGSRHVVSDLIEKLGGKISAKTVTLNTNYLVVGGSGSVNWSHGNYGSKIERAVELREQGRDIAIISEEHFMKSPAVSIEIAKR